MTKTMNLFQLATAVVILHLPISCWSFIPPQAAPTAALHQHRVLSTKPIQGKTITRLAPPSPSLSKPSSTTARHLAQDNNNDGDLPPGMMDAFSKLDALDSLGDPAADAAKAAPSSVKKIELDQDAVPVEELSPEKEAQMYTKMMADLDATDDLYSDVLTQMGSPAPPKPTPEISTTSTTASKEDMDQFMENALNDALEEVKLKGSDSLNADSILNDREIMKEIEAIFDRGSEQLMESLAEIRKEQESYAKESAASSAQEAADASSETAERLASAEASMQVMLDRVNKEAEQVEQAAQDLRAAQAELDKDMIVKLRNGGLPKQLSFVGLLLFSLRSIADSVGAIGGDDQTLLASALVQGGIALACAVVFFLF